MNSFYIEAIRKFEGYTPEAQWDYAQHSNGYGTRALYPGEVIDRPEAERRFLAEIANARALVERHAPNLDEGTKAALTSLTFNAGTRWVNSGLGDAVRRGDMEAVRSLFLEYTKAGGQELPGLVARRLAEAEWINNPGAVNAAGNGAGLQQPTPRVPTYLATGASGELAALMRTDERRAEVGLSRADPADGSRAEAPVTAVDDASDRSDVSAVNALLRLILSESAQDRALAGSGRLVWTADNLHLRATEGDKDQDKPSRQDVPGSQRI